MIQILLEGRTHRIWVLLPLISLVAGLVFSWLVALALH